MTTTSTFAFELPTGRRSYASPVSKVDTTSPTYIPVLNQEDLQSTTPYSEKELSPFHAASFSPLPTRPASPSQQENKSAGSKKERSTQPTHNYSKSSLAPEKVAQELEADPLPPRTSSKKTPGTAESLPQHLRQESAAAVSSDGQETVTSDGGADSSTAPSTSGTASMIEEQYYTLPGMDIKKEDIAPPTIPMSSRSSLASVQTARTIMAPTSKYSRKPISTRPPTIKSQPTTPHESPRIPPAIPASPAPMPPLEPIDNTKQEHAAKLHAAKSTASERRMRALHSHPSNQSLHTSQANSTSEPESRPSSRPPSVKNRSIKSPESRPVTPRSTIYDAQTPTPAPTTPLPSLPPEAYSKSHQQQRSGLSITPLPQLQEPAPVHIAPSIQQAKLSDHTEMASFMTSTNTVIFRRFDDVHVRLLLCLQDEIALLEKQLLKLDAGAPSIGDKTMQKMQIMRELRRVVAEYGMIRSASCQNVVLTGNRSSLRQLVANAGQQSKQQYNA